MGCIHWVLSYKSRSVGLRFPDRYRTLRNKVCAFTDMVTNDHSLAVIVMKVISDFARNTSIKWSRDLRNEFGVGVYASFSTKTTFVRFAISPFRMYVAFISDFTMNEILTRIPLQSVSASGPIDDSPTKSFVSSQRATSNFFESLGPTKSRPMTLRHRQHSMPPVLSLHT